MRQNVNQGQCARKINNNTIKKIYTNTKIPRNDTFNKNNN